MMAGAFPHRVSFILTSQAVTLTFNTFNTLTTFNTFTTLTSFTPPVLHAGLFSVTELLMPVGD